MGEETIYFQDDEYLVTSRRLVLLKAGKTIPINSVSEPKFEESPLYDARGWGEKFNPFDFILGLFTADEHFETQIGYLKVIVKIHGKEQFVTKCEYVHAVGNPFCLRHKSPDYEKECAKLRKLAIAIGAAISGV